MKITPEEIQHQTVLWSCLNWGKGHVYRSIPLIQKLQEKGNNIHIACDKKQQEIFKRYLKDVAYHFLKGYDFNFSSSKSMLRSNFFQLPKLLRQHSQDFLMCEKWVKEFSVDYVISDHRYGFCSKAIPSIFLTHQCNLPTRSRWIQKQHHRFINKNFNHVWILDDENHSFAGNLSKTDAIQIPFSYLGIVSRFENKKQLEKTKTIAIISGPAPFDQELLNFVQENAENTHEKTYVITSLDFHSEWLIPVATEQQDQIILEAKKIISYCGYTTLMDLEYLNPPTFELHPTPNQNEQLYLASIHKMIKK